jgi:hypothetical protein
MQLDTKEHVLGMRIFQCEANYLLQGYKESRLTSSFSKLYGRYNDIVCDYKLLLAYMMIFFPIPFC